MIIFFPKIFLLRNRHFLISFLYYADPILKIYQSGHLQYLVWCCLLHFLIMSGAIKRRDKVCGYRFDEPLGESLLQFMDMFDYGFVGVFFAKWNRGKDLLEGHFEGAVEFFLFLGEFAESDWMHTFLLHKVRMNPDC